MPKGTQAAHGGAGFRPRPAWSSPLFCWSSGTIKPVRKSGSLLPVQHIKSRPYKLADSSVTPYILHFLEHFQFWACHTHASVSQCGLPLETSLAYPPLCYYLHLFLLWTEEGLRLSQGHIISMIWFASHVCASSSLPHSMFLLNQHFTTGRPFIKGSQKQQNI